MPVRLYGAIRNSPVWDTSLLIITYDEHGRFYDRPRRSRRRGCMPWVRQWHSEIYLALGQSRAAAYDAYVTSECESRNLTEGAPAPRIRQRPTRAPGVWSAAPDTARTSEADDPHEPQ